MTKRIHYTQNGSTNAMCGTHYEQKRLTGRLGVHKELKEVQITSKEDDVTCTRCKEMLQKRNTKYVCPVCGESVDYLKVVETHTEQSHIYANRRYARVNKTTTDKELIKVICPACNNEIPVESKDWRSVSDKFLGKTIR